MAFFDFFKDYSFEASEIKNYLINTWGMRSEYAIPFVEVYKSDLGRLVSQGRKKMSDVNVKSLQGQELLKTFSDNDLRFSVVGQSYHAYFKDLRNGRHLNSPIEYAIWGILYFENDLVAAQNFAFANFIMKNVDEKAPGIERVLIESQGSFSTDVSKNKSDETPDDRIKKIQDDAAEKIKKAYETNSPEKTSTEQGIKSKNDGEVEKDSKIITDVEFYEILFQEKGFLTYILSKPASFFNNKIDAPQKIYVSDVNIRLNSYKNSCDLNDLSINKTDCQKVISPIYVLIISLACRKLGATSVATAKIALDFFIKRSLDIYQLDSCLYEYYCIDRLEQAAKSMLTVIPNFSYNEPSEKLLLESTRETIIELSRYV